MFNTPHVLMSLSLCLRVVNMHWYFEIRPLVLGPPINGHFLSEISQDLTAGTTVQFVKFILVT